MASYAILIGSVLGLCAVAVRLGSGNGGAALARPSTAHPLSSPTWHLGAAIGGILLLCRCGGWLARKVGQPDVVGEIVAGVLLGPSLLGAVAPSLMTTIMPPDLRSALGAFAGVGVSLFAFGVGLELHSAAFRHRGHMAVAVSHASIALPFVGGCFLALSLKGELGPPGAFAPFCLFLGAAMSITAFPVLARILEETGLLRTHLGQMSILCAAVDDVTAWIVLSLVVALARAGGWLPTVRTFVLAGILVALMLGPVRRLLDSVGGRPARASTSVAASVALLTAAVTDWMGLHVIFGAFLAGCAMPRSGPLAEKARQLAPLATGILLPLFFVTSGLQVNLRDLGQHPGELVAGLAIMAVAISGKMLGAGFGALWGGATRRDAVAIGVLMNTRGLTELIVLGVGLQLGVLSPPLYTLLVLMALITTGMTTPLLRCLGVSGRMDIEENAAPIRFP